MADDIIESIKESDEYKNRKGDLYIMEIKTTPKIFKDFSEAMNRDLSDDVEITKIKIE